jgi:phosphoenolpyruvate phosphomutase
MTDLFPSNTGGAAALRRLLASPGPIVIAGAHHGLGARLVEEAGFHGVWASGFEISASYGVPDASILTMTETLDAARKMADAVRIPVIADCDTGFGNAINAIRTVEAFEAAGVAGLCIEDNIYPKRCSFYPGVRRQLADLDEQALKIKACVNAGSREFSVIARTEALIAGWGLEEALRRGRAYADAGADAVLIPRASQRSMKSRVSLKNGIGSRRSFACRRPITAPPSMNWRASASRW